MLIKSDLPQLRDLYLSTFLEFIDLEKCSFGSEGAKHLSKGRWP